MLGVVSADTESQLRTKTWPELAKWAWPCINRDFFAYTATALHSVLPGKDPTWRADCITWSANHTEAIAGLHHKGRSAFALLVEASAIPDGVRETIEAALTDVVLRSAISRRLRACSVPTRSRPCARWPPAPRRDLRVGDLVRLLALDLIQEEGREWILTPLDVERSALMARQEGRQGR